MICNRLATEKIIENILTRAEPRAKHLELKQSESLSKIAAIDEVYIYLLLKSLVSHQLNSEVIKNAFIYALKHLKYIISDTDNMKRGSASNDGEELFRNGRGLPFVLSTCLQNIRHIHSSNITDDILASIATILNQNIENEYWNALFVSNSVGGLWVLDIKNDYTQNILGSLEAIIRLKNLKFTAADISHLIGGLRSFSDEYPAVRSFTSEVACALERSCSNTITGNSNLTGKYLSNAISGYLIK